MATDKAQATGMPATATPVTNSTAPASAEVVPAFTGLVVPVPLNTAEGIALIRVEEVRPSILRPLEEVRAEIEIVLQMEEATRLAHTAAVEALPSFTGTEIPAAFTGRVNESEGFARGMPLITSLDNSFALAEALLSSDGKSWLPGVYDIAKGTVIARVSSIELPAEQEWAGGKEMVMREMIQGKSQEVVNAFLRRLYASASIEETPGVLDQIRFR
jgi:peptidyl-prolyl cis-trans isomerase D